MSWSNVSISGSVNLDTGTIGGWIVDDESSEVHLEMKIQELYLIQVYQKYNYMIQVTNRKVGTNPNDSLSSPDSSDINVTNIGSTTNGTTVSSTTSGSYSSVSSWIFVQGDHLKYF